MGGSQHNPHILIITIRGVHVSRWITDWARELLPHAYICAVHVYPIQM